MNRQQSQADSSSMTVGMRGLRDLFNETEHRVAQRLCREMGVTSSDVFTFALAGWTKALGPYECRIQNIDHIPADLRLTAKDKGTIEAKRFGLAPRSAINALHGKLRSVFAKRRLFNAYLFVLPGEQRWHLIYFDQRDRAGDHWVEGPHIHYVRQTHTRMSVEQVWAEVCATPPKPPRGEHIRCTDPP